MRWIKAVRRTVGGLGVFTNLSRDHLDYHSSMEAYCEAKLKLFRDFNPAARIYNADDDMISQHADVVCWRDRDLGQHPILRCVFRYARQPRWW